MLEKKVKNVGLNCAENPKKARWKSSLLWYLVSDLGLELSGQITLPKVLYRTARSLPMKTAILQKEEGKYLSTSYGDLLKQIEHFAASLVKLGVQKGEKVAILLKNSLEWTITDFGILMVGGVTVPLYFTLNQRSIEEIINDSEASILVVEGKEKLELVLPILENCPKLKWILVKEELITAYSHPQVLSFKQILKEGEENWKTFGDEVAKRRDEATYHSIATLIYTSGTTGTPKGVILTHRNILSNVLGVYCISEMDEKDLALSILPLSHAFERAVGYYLPLLIGSSIAFAESYNTILENLKEVHPTFCAAVPRIFEKIYENTNKKLERSGFFKRALFHWALKVGKEVSDYKEELLSLGYPDRRVRHRPEDRYNHMEPPIRKRRLKLKWWLARILVYNNFKKILGNRLKYFLSGGAPLRADICRFFRNLDIYIYEGYGLTETSPVIAFNYRNKLQPGTVGKLLPWLQLKIEKDGEICVKGPSIMKGYYKKPEETAEVLDTDGWFHTGDIGFLDKNNFLHITDRKKELIVMSNGKKVAPLAIEGLLNEDPLISQSVVLGNNRKYIAALIVPNFQELEILAKKHKIVNSDTEGLVNNETLCEYFENIIKVTNNKLSRYEQIKRFKLIDHEFTQEAGEITPTLKIKRKLIEKKYAEIVEELYPEHIPTESERIISAATSA